MDRDHRLLLVTSGQGAYDRVESQIKFRVGGDIDMRAIVFPLRLLLRCWLALAVVLAFITAPAFAASTAPESRVALIIANSKYEKARALANPSSDAQLIKATLSALHFTSIRVVENVTRSEMESALRDFSLQADRADVALIYYAGHGMELNNTNYLIPTDAHLARDRDAEIEAIKLDTVLQMTQGARRLRVVILDACRNNPFDAAMIRTGNATRSVSRGLAPIEPAGESLVVYSAKAGQVAADGNKTNSPFARALARRMVEEGSEISLTFRKVRDDVLQETSGDQEPFTYGSLSSREFYFRPPQSSAPGQMTNDIEAQAWDLCKSAASRRPCDAYLAKYKQQGKYSELASLRLADIAPAQTVPAPQVAAGGPETARMVSPAPASAGVGAGSRRMSAMGADKPVVVAVGPIVSAKDCRLYMATAGHQETYADPLVYASRSSWVSWFYKDCVSHFDGIRTAIQSALASSGRVVVGPGGFTLGGRLSDVVQSDNGSAGGYGQNGSYNVASQGMSVTFDLNLKDGAGRIVFGIPLTKRIETGGSVRTGEVDAVGGQSGEGIYAVLQQRVALAAARRIAFHYAPLHVVSVNAGKIQLNYGMPLLSAGMLVSASSPDGSASVRYRVTSASDGNALADKYSDGDESGIVPGSRAVAIEDDDPAANQPRFDRVELP